MKQWLKLANWYVIAIYFICAVTMVGSTVTHQVPVDVTFLVCGVMVIGIVNELVSNPAARCFWRDQIIRQLQVDLAQATSRAKVDGLLDHRLCRHCGRFLVEHAWEDDPNRPFGCPGEGPIPDGSTAQRLYWTERHSCYQPRREGES